MNPMYILIGAVVLIAVYFVAIYNGLVVLKARIQEALSGIDVQLKRRSDLIPNLVETVKGYAAHERQTLQGVIEARSKISQMNVNPDVINSPEAFSKFQAAQNGLSSALSRLMVVVERYPDLKANANFLELQSQLEGTENRITVERKRYNDAAQNFNTLRRTIPTILIATFMNFPEKSYFKAEEGASKAPQVKF